MTLASRARREVSGVGESLLFGGFKRLEGISVPIAEVQSQFG